MSIIVPARGHIRDTSSPFNRALFGSPEPAGRKITTGFTYIQRISKPASYDVWFPDHLKEMIEARYEAGLPVGREQFPAQWAAVRQFELLQESGNLKIYDLDPGNLKRATLDLSRSMRAGGYRVTVATMGSYREGSGSDELEILDKRLQRRIAQMIHMLYLDEQSDEANSQIDAKLSEGSWNYLDALPHVGMVLGSESLFKRIPLNFGQAGENDAMSHHNKRRKDKGGKEATHANALRFFEIIGQLPQEHIVHDTAIGLQLPELNGNNDWNYIAASDETLDAFNRVLNQLFDPFNGLSLSRLNGHEDAGSEIKSSTFHMRSYGHPLTESASRFYRNSAHALS